LGPERAENLRIARSLDFKSPNIYIEPFLLIESKSIGGCLQFEDLKEELGPQRFGDPKISPRP
jgi:hypothetical protein